MKIHQNRPNACAGLIVDLPPGAVFVDEEEEVCLRTEGGCVCLKDGIEMDAHEGDKYIEELPEAVLVTHGLESADERLAADPRVDDAGVMVEWCPACGDGIDSGYVMHQFEAEGRVDAFGIVCPLCRAGLDVVAVVAPEFRLVASDSDPAGAQAERG